MKRKIGATYLIIVATLLIMMSLTRNSNETIRGESIAATSPFWKKVLSMKYFLFHPFQPSPFEALSHEEKKNQFEMEKRLLHTEIEYLQAELNELKLLNLQNAQIQKSESKRQKSILGHRIQAIPARVIFRPFDAWDQALWIDAGESILSDNGEPVIAINSPVISGSAIIGIIDYVGKKQSRVRLITDSRLNPSVRASRGGEQDYQLREQIERLSIQLSNKKGTLLTENENVQLFQLLNKLKEGLLPVNKNIYLAKGELRGLHPSSKVKDNLILHGTGFNYDFSDSEGGSRDLRSGKPIKNPKGAPIPILKVDDILVTTGMDGIFPPGFQVAVISKIDLLKEGDYYYDLEAKPIALPLEELSLVFVLPPVKSESTP